MSLVPFFIPNSSPLLSYSPCTECGPESWQSAYTPRPDSYDQTFHQTTYPNQTISFNLTSNGFGVMHATVSPECPLEYSINGSDFRSTCDTSGTGNLQDLQWGRHEVVLRTGNITIFQLSGITGNHLVGDKHVNRTLDNTDSGISYTPEGAWGFIHDDGSMTGNTSVLDDFLNEDKKVAARSTLRLRDGEAAKGRYSRREVPGNTSVSVTEFEAQVNLMFKGSAVYVYGQSGPDGGQARVHLDSHEVAELNMTSKWETDDVLVYTTSGLDAAKEHHLTIENLIMGKRLTVDYAIISQPQTRPAKSKSIAPLIAGVIGGIILIILLGIILYFYLVARMKYKLRSPTTPSSGSRRTNSKAESWRKQTPPQSADACSPMDTYHTESIYGGILAPLASTPNPNPNTRKSLKGKFKRGDSGNWPIAKLYTSPHNKGRRGGSFALGSESGGTNISAPSYPDYIPYKSPSNGSGTETETWTQSGRGESPIPPVPSVPSSALFSSRLGTNGHSASLMSARSNGTPLTGVSSKSGKGGGLKKDGKDSPAGAPAIVGLDASAERWIQENTYLGQSQTPHQQNQPRRSLSTTSHRSVISRTDAGSPIPEDGEGAEIVGVHRAQNARRSIARLWPSKDAVPSLYINTMTESSLSQDIPLQRSSNMNQIIRPPGAIVTRDQTISVPISASLTTTPDLSSNISLIDSNSNSNPSYIRLNPTSSGYAFTTPHLATYTPSSSNSPKPKSQAQHHRQPQTDHSVAPQLRRGVSVKSVKSFFSGWTKPVGGVVETRSGRETPARPDSGIFPSSLGMGLGLGTVELPLDTSSIKGSDGQDAETGTGGSGGTNMFIELDPESPLTASRPPSEWPRGRI